MSGELRPDGNAPSPERAAELARAFLSAMFMGLRTAQVHDPQNAAFQNAIDTVRRAAGELYSVTGPFTFQLVEGSIFLNGTRLRFDGNLFQTMKKLSDLLESRQMGGIKISGPPSEATIRKLILLFAPGDHQRDSASKEDLEAGHIGLLGVQRFAEARTSLQIDRRIFAVQTYAKLMLALTEQRERLQREETSSSGASSPRLRAVRLMHDLVELAQDRIDFLTKLGMNRSGAAPNLLLAVNSALYAVALGQAVGLGRQDLVSVGVAALFHDVDGASDSRAASADGPLEPALGLEVTDGLSRVPCSSTEAELRASFGRILASGDLGRSGLLRAAIVGEQARLTNDRFAWGSARPWPHPFSRLVGTALLFSALTLGVGPELSRALHPLDALLVMMRDTTERIDPHLVDALINLLRAYPVGAEVLLDSGRRGRVHHYTDRWDRPVVQLRRSAGEAELVDLSALEDGRFGDRIRATLMFLGEPELPVAAPARGRSLVAPEIPRASLLAGPRTQSYQTEIPRGGEEVTALDTTVIPPLDAELTLGPVTADLLPPASEEDTPPPHPFFIPDDATEEHALPPEFEGNTERVSEPVSQIDFEVSVGSAPITEVEPLPTAALLDHAAESSGSMRLLGYELLAEIDRRDHRRVYAGRDGGDGSDTLIYTLVAEDLPGGAAARERALLLFEREARLAGRVSHPALPRLKLAGLHGDTRVLVYERPEGTKLRYRLMAGQTFESRSLRRLVRGVAEALHHLHERGVVFCALGPETVSCTEEGDASLLDLSLAAPMDEAPHPRLLEQAYLLSPEFRSGARFGPKSDQYALGGLLYEMLTGKNPGGALAQSPARLRAPDELNAGADPLLSAAAMRMLDPLPGARFESCEAIAMHLTRSE